MQLFIPYEDIKKLYNLYCSSTNSNMSYDEFLKIFKFGCVSLLLSYIYMKLKG